jgi:hypothetical protein
MCITFKVIPLFMRLIQDIRILYLQLDFLLYREVLPILLLRYSTHHHIKSED